MTIEQIAAAFNEWMRRYTEDPHAFEAEWQTVTAFLTESAAGKTASYGEECAAYLQSLVHLAPVALPEPGLLENAKIGGDSLR